jgi:hypothetical protein
VAREGSTLRNPASQSSGRTVIRSLGFALLTWIAIIPIGMILNHISFSEAFGTGMAVAALIVVAPFCANISR